MTQIKLDPTTCEIIVGLHTHFNDFDKMCFWLVLDNPEMGCKPIELINAGKGKKVLQLIDAALKENER